MRVDHGLQQTGKNFNLLYAVAAYRYSLLCCKSSQKVFYFIGRAFIKKVRK